MKARIVDNQPVEFQPDGHVGLEGEVWVQVNNNTLRDNVFTADWSGRSVSQLIDAMYFDLFQLKNVNVGEFQYVYNVETQVVNEILDAAPLLPIKLEQLSAYRYEKEVGGTTFMGVQLDTSRPSQSLIIGARLAAMSNAAYTVNWKAANGWTTLDAPTIIVISDAVRAHIQSCFDAEKLHSENMSAIVDAFELMTYDFSTGWPS